jgi:methionyl-tRNA synthetase
VIDLFGSDALRFYLLREVAFGGDGAVSPEGFETRYTTELANEYGNLASRTLAMVARYRDGAVPAGGTVPDLAPELEGLAERVCERFDRVDVSGALEQIWRGVRRLNQWVQEEAPWQLAKEADRAERLDEVLWGLVEGLRVVSILLHPFMPDATIRLLDAIGADDRSLAAARFGSGSSGGSVGELEPLFPRVEREAQPAA